MNAQQITLDTTRNMLIYGTREVRIESRHGVAFVVLLRTRSVQKMALTADAWRLHLQDLGMAVPDRTGMRRLLRHIEQCFDHLGWVGPRPVVLSPVRGATVGPWQLREDACQRLDVRHTEAIDFSHHLACLVLTPAPRSSQHKVEVPLLGGPLEVLNCFLIGDDLARNGMFADAAASMAKALALHDLAPELKCVLHLRMVKYLRRAGQFAKARTNLAQVQLLAATLRTPMRGHMQAELAVQSWRLKYDDVGHTDAYPANPVAAMKGPQYFQPSEVDSRLMWQQFNLWASEWRRQMEMGDAAAVQSAFNNARKGYEAAIYWALVSEDALNVMNVVANMGYLLHLAGKKRLADLSVEALDWLLLSHAYIERFEWPEESLWDYVYLAELYLTSTTVREHLKSRSAYVMNALTPDTEEFYTHALRLGIRLGEPRQLANMYQAFIDYLKSRGRFKKAQVQAELLEGLLEQHPGLRKKLLPAAPRAAKAIAATPP